MTVERTNIFSGPYIGNGVTTTFPIDFHAASGDEVAGTVGGIPVDRSQFSVTLNDDGTGAATFFVAPVGEVILFSDPLFSQETNFEDQGPFYQASVNEPIDRSALRDLVLRDGVSRSLKLPFGSGAAPLLASVAYRLGGKVLGFNPITGDPEVQGAGAFKGDPGANVMAIGLFTQAVTLSIPIGTNAVRTSGYAVTGKGVADYSFDPAVDAAFVAAYPGGGFVSANGRGFRLIAQDRVNVLWLGAVGDGATDDTAAIKRALALGVLYNLPIFAPGLNYIVSDTLRVRTGLVGVGPATRFTQKDTASFPGLKPIIHVGWPTSESSLPADRLQLEGFWVYGSGVRPALRSSDPAAIATNSVGIYFDEQCNRITGSRITVTNCFYGAVYNNRFGHLGFRDSVFNNNWINNYWQSNTGDYLLDSCDLAAALFSCIGAAANDLGDFVHLGGIFGLSTFRTHMGFAPYLYYQPDGTSTISIVGSPLDHRHEQIGNAVYRCGVSTAGQRVFGDNTFIQIGHSWTDAVADLGSYNAYTIQGDGNYPVQPYALDIQLCNAPVKIISGTSFLPAQNSQTLIGTKDVAVRIANLFAPWSDCMSIYPYLVTGSGAERLVMSSSAGWRSTQLFTNKKLGADGGGNTDFPVATIPKVIDNTLYGYVSFSTRVNNTAGGPFTKQQVRAVVNGVETNVLAFVDIPTGESNITFPPLRFPLGRRNRGTDTHTVAFRIKYGGGAQVDTCVFSPDIAGQVVFSAAQWESVL